MPDLFGHSAQAVSRSVRRYFSGCGAPAIFDGYRDAGVPVCLVVGGLSSAMVQRAAAAVADGAEMLLDSGAFIHRKSPERVVWPEVLAAYLLIGERGKVSLVLPDVVGSQEQTLVLLERHKTECERLKASGHEVLLPLQSGGMPIETFYRAAVDALGFQPSGIALPSHACAMPVSALKGLSQIGIGSRRLHLLGISRNGKKLTERVLAIRAEWPDAVLSADACEHRAAVGAGRRVTVARTSSLRGLVEGGLEAWDDTEDEDVDVAARRNLAALMPGLSEEELDEVMSSGWGVAAAIEAKRGALSKALGPVATRESIRTFACETNASR